MKIQIRPLNERVVDRSQGRSPNFRSGWPETRDLLEREASHLGAREIIIEAAFAEHQIRQDGWPRAGARAAHPEVVVRLLGTKHGDLRYEAAVGYSWQDNVRAVALGLESLRRVERYGIASRGEQYAGWKQLAAPGVERGAALIREHGSKRAALAATHPDNGGDVEDFHAVQGASDAV